MKSSGTAVNYQTNEELLGIPCKAPWVLTMLGCIKLGFLETGGRRLVVDADVAGFG